jgi:hypothetical protein
MRDNNGLTQSEVAEKLGVSLRTVGNWERGQVIPRKHWDALSFWYGLSAEQPSAARVARLEQALAEIESQIPSIGARRQLKELPDIALLEELLRRARIRDVRPDLHTVDLDEELYAADTKNGSPDEDLRQP